VVEEGKDIDNDKGKYVLCWVGDEKGERKPHNHEKK
jgi:hypothetical protein